MAFRHKKRASKANCGGFTLVEVMIASGLTVLLSVIIFESVLFCNRMAYDVKSRLAADAIAYDTAWELFNRQLTWFKAMAGVEAISRWEPLDETLYDVWGARSGEVLVYSEILPEGLPATNWEVRVKVQWPALSGGGVSTLTREFYEVNRQKTDRNLFRATK